jgi:hypothetical protein
LIIKLRGCKELMNNTGELKNKTQRQMQLKFCKTVMELPVPMFGSEIWNLLENENKQIDAAEMCFLRSLIGISLREDIRQNLQIINIEHEILYNGHK